jgi:hypothetical protein
MATALDKKTVTKWIKKWRKILLLQHWTVHVTFVDTQTEDDLCCRAEVEFDIVYLEIKIKIYPIFWDDPVIARERTILHELSHTLVEPLKRRACKCIKGKGRKYLQQVDEVQREVETLTEYITNLLWDCYEE